MSLLCISWTPSIAAGSWQIIMIMVTFTSLKRRLSWNYVFHSCLLLFSTPGQDGEKFGSIRWHKYRLQFRNTLILLLWRINIYVLLLYSIFGNIFYSTNINHSLFNTNGSRQLQLFFYYLSVNKLQIYQSNVYVFKLHTSISTTQQPFYFSHKKYILWITCIHMYVNIYVYRVHIAVLTQSCFFYFGYFCFHYTTFQNIFSL
jgi:hypothetical protein